MRRTIIVLCALIAMALLIGFYYTIDPTHCVWMPKCIFHTLTGFDCPACGLQRALHALLHGHWSEALACNPFLIVSILYLSFVVYAQQARDGMARRLRSIVYHPCVVQGYVIVFVGWWIVRNLL